MCSVEGSRLNLLFAEAGSDDDDDDDDDNDDNDDEDDDDEAPELVPADEGDGRKSGKKVRFNDGGDDDDEDGENGDEMGDNDDEQEDDEEEEEDELPAPEEAAVRTLTNAEFEAIERARKRKVRECYDAARARSGWCVFTRKRAGGRSRISVWRRHDVCRCRSGSRRIGC